MFEKFQPDQRAQFQLESKYSNQGIQSTRGVIGLEISVLLAAFAARLERLSEKIITTGVKKSKAKTQYGIAKVETLPKYGVENAHLRNSLEDTGVSVSGKSVKGLPGSVSTSRCFIPVPGKEPNPDITLTLPFPISKKQVFPLMCMAASIF